MESVTQNQQMRPDGKPYLASQPQHVIDGVVYKRCTGKHGCNQDRRADDEYWNNPDYEDGKDCTCIPCRKARKERRKQEQPQQLDIDRQAVEQYRAVLVQTRGTFFDPRSGRINLTELWRAVGSPVGKETWEWLRLPSTKEFIRAVASHENLEPDQVIDASTGRSGATWAHWQVGANYAKYLSPEFNIAWNEFAKAHIEGHTKTAPVSNDPMALMSLLEDMLCSVIDQRIDGLREEVMPHLKRITVVTEEQIVERVTYVDRVVSVDVRGVVYFAQYPTISDNLIHNP